MKKTFHKYKVVDNSGSAPNIEKFFYTLKEAEEYVFRNNGKVLGKLKSKLEIEETDIYRMSKNNKEVDK